MLAKHSLPKAQLHESKLVKNFKNDENVIKVIKHTQVKSSNMRVSIKCTRKNAIYLRFGIHEDQVRNRLYCIYNNTRT